MGVRIIEDRYLACLYDSVTDVAFGPVFYSMDEEEAGENVSAGMVAEEFLKYLSEDARTYDHKTLMAAYKDFRDLIDEHGWYGVFGEEVGSGV